MLLEAGCLWMGVIILGFYYLDQVLVALLDPRIFERPSHILTSFGRFLLRDMVSLTSLALIEDGAGATA